MFDVIPTNHQVWLICGGRDFADSEVFNSAMGDLIRLRGIPACVVHGGAAGADMLAALWAARYGISAVAFPADWDKHGKAAGPIRNQEMLERGRPKFVVAFPGGRGTADMVRRARDAGVDIAEIQIPERENRKDDENRSGE